jgi:hypothetical protein
MIRKISLNFLGVKCSKQKKFVFIMKLNYDSFGWPAKLWVFNLYYSWRWNKLPVSRDGNSTASKDVEMILLWIMKMNVFLILIKIEFRAGF